MTSRVPGNRLPNLTSHHSGKYHPGQNAGCSRRPRLFWYHRGHLLGAGGGGGETVSSGRAPREGRRGASKSKRKACKRLCPADSNRRAVFTHFRPFTKRQLVNTCAQIPKRILNLQVHTASHTQSVQPPPYTRQSQGLNYVVSFSSSNGFPLPLVQNLHQAASRACRRWPLVLHFRAAFQSPHVLRLCAPLWGISHGSPWGLLFPPASFTAS